MGRLPSPIGVPFLRVLALVCCAGCASGGTPWFSAPPPAPLPAPTPHVSATSQQQGPPEDLPDVAACILAYRESRLDVIHRHADALLSHVSEPDARLTILMAATGADYFRRDFEAVWRHISLFREERKASGTAEDSRDLGIGVFTGATMLAQAVNEGELNQARIVLGVARMRLSESDDIPWLPSLQVASYAARPWYFLPVYRGKYEGEDLQSRARSALEEALPGAMERVRNHLRRPDLEFPPLAVRFADGEAARTQAYMSTGIYVVSRRSVAVVTVYAEHYRAGRTRCSEWLAHELVHAIHSGTGPDFGGPSWLSEGLAHWTSGESEDMSRALSLSMVTEDPIHAVERLVWILMPPDALVRESQEIQRAAGALMFRLVERSRGLETMRRLANRLLDSGDYRAAFRDVLGSTPERIFEEARREVPAWFRENFPRWDETASIYRLWGEGKHEEAIAQCDHQFGQESGDELERYFARVARIFALRELERWDQAVDGIRELQESSFALISFASLRYGELKYLRRAERWEEVARIGREALRDIVWEDEKEEADIEAWVEEAEAKLKR